MRAYFFGNFYLSSIQQGIQAAHVVSEMSVKYSPGLPPACDYEEWAHTHKTMILLNGGMAANLRELVACFDTKDNSYCWAFFCEEEAALEGSITSVGIILPDTIYNTAAEWRAGGAHPSNLLDIIDDGDTIGMVPRFSEFQVELMTMMNNCRLAS